MGTGVSTVNDKDIDEKKNKWSYRKQYVCVREKVKEIEQRENESNVSE